MKRTRTNGPEMVSRCRGRDPVGAYITRVDPLLGAEEPLPAAVSLNPESLSIYENLPRGGDSHLSANLTWREFRLDKSFETYVELMYWTYENWVHKYARVHRADCVYCNDGLGFHDVANSPAGRWLGPFEHFDNASLASEYGATPCGHCSPSNQPFRSQFNR